MRRKSWNTLSSDPAGQVIVVLFFLARQLSAILTVVVAVAGAAVDALGWCSYQWRLRQYRRIVRNAWIGQGLCVDPVRLEERAKLLAKARGMPPTTMSKRVGSVTVGDFFAFAVWKILKVSLVVLIGIALAMAVSIWRTQNEIAKLEALIR